MKKTTFTSFRKTLARMVEIGASNDLPSRSYDFLITGVIIVNLVAVVLDTFQSVRVSHVRLLDRIETVTAFCYLVDYLLRLVAATWEIVRCANLHHARQRLAKRCKSRLLHGFPNIIPKCRHP